MFLVMVIFMLSLERLEITLLVRWRACVVCICIVAKIGWGLIEGFGNIRFKRSRINCGKTLGKCKGLRCNKGFSPKTTKRCNKGLRFQILHEEEEEEKKKKNTSMTLTWLKTWVGMCCSGAGLCWRIGA